MIRKQHIQGLVWLVVLLGGCVAGWFYWQHTALYPSTDDAYVQAHSVSIAPQVSGPIQSISVRNHQAVVKGSVLFTIDSTPFAFAVKKAEAELGLAYQNMRASEDAIAVAKAQVTERQAELIDQQKQTKRYLALVAQNQLSKAEGDTAQSKLEVAIASVTAAQKQLSEAKQTLGVSGEQNVNVRAAKSTLAQTKLDLSHTKITAPASGTLVNFKLRPGSMVQSGQTLFQLIEAKSWWIDANFKETQLERIHPGQAATVLVDLYPSHPFQGTVVAVNEASGDSFSLLPAENATGNWVKVTQRFPVKIKINQLDAARPLRLGATSTVTVNTTNAP